MPENKKETNVDSVKKLGDFKATKLADLIGDISREKSRASVLMASLKSKRDALVTKAKEEKLKAERKVDELKRKRRRLRNELDDREDEIGDKRKKMIAEIEKKMVQNVNNEDIFLIRWQIN